MKIAIAGSMKFAKDMIDVKEGLEAKGHDVIVPQNIEKYAAGTMTIENKWEKIQYDLIKSYFEEIKNCDALFLVNKDKDNIKNYIGGNSLIEMAFAHVLNKKIFLLNPIPEMNYTDEIEAMSPIILNNELEKVK